MAVMKLIGFNPTRPAFASRRKQSGSRTQHLLRLLMREEGVTLEELQYELNKHPGMKKLDMRQLRSWLTPSFLAPMGYGIHSEYEEKEDGTKTLRLYGIKANLSRQQKAG